MWHMGNSVIAVLPLHLVAIFQFWLQPQLRLETRPLVAVWTKDGNLSRTWVNTRGVVLLVHENVHSTRKTPRPLKTAMRTFDLDLSLKC